MADQTQQLVEKITESKFPSRKSQAALGDLEMISDISAVLGPLTPKDIDPSKIKALLGDVNSKHRGFSVPEGMDPLRALLKAVSTVKVQPLSERDADVLSTISPGDILTIGAENANPRVLAHEIAHQKLDMDEIEARILDMATARNFEEYIEPLRFLAVISGEPPSVVEKSALRSIKQTYGDIFPNRFWTERFEDWKALGAIDRGTGKPFRRDAQVFRTLE